jgi:galactosyl transferase GMA12/MNN10 family
MSRMTLLTSSTDSYWPMVDVAHDRLGLNNGVFLLRNCLMGREFLRGVLDRRGKDIHDQQAMQNVMATMPELKVGLVPQRSMNSYLYEEYPTIKADEAGQWQPGDFILHLPGLGFERRMELLKEYLCRVVR